MAKSVTAPSTQSATLTASFATAMTDAQAWLTAAYASSGSDHSGADRALFDWMLRQIQGLNSGNFGPVAGVPELVTSPASLASRQWVANP